MALSGAAILPHSPLLIPTIAGDNLKQADNTIVAIKKLLNHFKSKEIDTAIIISTHGPQLEESFMINHCPIFYGDFEKFGDLITKVECGSDIGLSYQIKESLETKVPLVLACEEKLDYSITVPMFYIKQCCAQVNLVPIYTSCLSGKRHYEFGQLMRHTIENSSKKIAVLAVGDLGRLKQDDDGANPQVVKEYDDTLIRLLKSKNINELLNLDKELLTASNECLYLALLVLLGIVDKKDYKTDIYSYQKPFGVGLLTANLEV